MKTVALIPVKMNSTRLPGKNTKPFYDGTPLMHFIQKVCLKSKLIDDVYVYCSDDIAKDYLIPGVKFIKRPKFLDGDDMNANDIIREFMKKVIADVYVNANTTSPFANIETIDKCIKKVTSGENDSAFCAENLKTFLWRDNMPINFDPDHFPRTQDLPSIYAETSIAYVFSKETFMKYNRRVGIRPYVCEVGKIEAIDIDNLEDFILADAVYKYHLSKL